MSIRNTVVKRIAIMLTACVVAFTGIASSAVPVQAATKADDSKIELLAALIFCEAGGESYEGQLAVGAVVVNRMNSKSYPNTLKGVIYQRGQFGPASSGILAKRIGSRIVTDSCYEAAEEALNGVSNVGNLTHFQNKRCGKSGIIIGNHVFY